MTNESGLTRRDFVKTTTAVAAAAALGGNAFADGDPPPLKVGLIGCGGRGTGAAEDCMSAAPNVNLVAMGDLFPDRLASSKKYLAGRKLPGFQVEEGRCHVGFDAYKRVLDSDIDLALLTTPPGFRPLHVEAAVDAGKHVFMEKPVSVDAPGVRRILAAGAKAKEENLAIISGTQYRHHEKFIETIKRLDEGAIGDVMAGRAFYNVTGAWHRGRKDEWSEMEYQLRNWYYFCWLSGDHFVEQHIHTIDVTDWVMGSHPLRAVAVGGRQARTDPKYGNIYDHFAVDYEYPGGRHVMSMARQLPGAAVHVGAHFKGTKGTAAPYTGTIEGENAWKYEGKAKLSTAYRQEHADLIASIRAGTPLNMTKQVAESTLTAIMGREAAYTGEVVEWDALMKSDLALMTDDIAFGPATMRPVPIPGQGR